MSRARGATSLAGILLVDKPTGMTSHDVVHRIRVATGEGRVGHAGTLDPAATGLLVMLIGPYTRLEPYLSGAQKTYVARIAFGVATDTDDADGSVIDAAAIPETVLDSHAAQSVLDSFLGEAMQAPPAYSAIKVDGRVSHRAARAGESLALAPRPIRVSSAELLGIDAAARTWDVRFVVSKGTYIRALARDIGVACGTLAHLSALCRTAAGLAQLEDAHTLYDAVEGIGAGHLEALLSDPVALLGMRSVEAEPEAVANGRALAATLAPETPDDALVAVTVGGRLYGVYRRAGEVLKAASIVGAGGVG